MSQEERKAPEGEELAPEEAVGPAQEAGEATEDEREAMRHLEEEIGKLTVADHLLLMMHSLSSLAVDRMGITPQTRARRDPEQARMAIDAFKALLAVVEGKLPAAEIREHRDVLSQLQMAYVSAL
jgi:hypothetical protein